MKKRTPLVSVLCRHAAGRWVSEMRLPRKQREGRGGAKVERENAGPIASVVDLRPAGVHRKRFFDFAFTTDEVGARVQMRYASNGLFRSSGPNRKTSSSFATHAFAPAEVVRPRTTG